MAGSMPTRARCLATSGTVCSSSWPSRAIAGAKRGMPGMNSRRIAYSGCCITETSNQNADSAGT
jgi:hypothetical protein